MQILRTPDEGADTLVWLAAARDPAWPGVALAAGGVLWLLAAWRRRG